MMVNPYDDSRLMLALQIDHSRVAGFFAAHWGNKDFDRPEPYSSVVLAAHEHDIGWWEWEMKPSTLNDKGYPLDYHDGSLKYLGQLRLDFYKNAVDHPFDSDPLPVSFTGKLVPRRTYNDGEDFLGEFYRAEQISIKHMLASA